jgi:NAD(P)-dependent dehydrogenase (short-subunit alcohol dehydrogenase family)
MTSTTPDHALSGRSALVTGSTSGIGAAIARELATNGARVLVTGRNAQRGAGVVDDITRAGGQAQFLPSDLAAGPETLRAFAADAAAALNGRLDLLVHNAAVCPPVDTLSLTDADLEEALAVNVRAPHVLTAALVPAMLEGGHGTVIMIGSWMAGVGSPIVGLYSATKAAEEQLTRSWAAEFGPRGIRCVTVSPGVTRTPINEDAADVLDQLAATTPAGRTVAPEALARAVAWLASDAAEFVHGATLAVDGGISTTRLN